MREPIPFSGQIHQFVTQPTRLAAEDIFAIERQIDDLDVRVRYQPVRSLWSHNHANRIDAVRERKVARLRSHPGHDEALRAVQPFSSADAATDRAGDWKNQLDIAVRHDQPARIISRRPVVVVDVDPRDDVAQLLTRRIKANAHAPRPMSQSYNTGSDGGM